MSLAETLPEIRPLDRASESVAQERLDSLTKPQGSLGRLEELARRIAVIQGLVPPRLGQKLIFVFAADHGITEEGVSAYPKSVTAQMIHNFLNGGAAINVMARQYGVDTEVVDMGVDVDFPHIEGLHQCKVRRGTANFARGPAMTRAQALQSIDLGIHLTREAATKNLFLLGTGDMGIGNTSSATAIFCALTGIAPAAATGRGTGIDDVTLARKIFCIEKGLELNRPEVNDPLDVLAKVGGFEIGAITGVILAAARFHIPMLLDGLIAGAAALLAQRFCPEVRDVLFASHVSAEPAHRMMLEELRLAPVLDLRMRLGEGTGACLLMGLLETAVRIMDEMATFPSAGIKEKLP
ncbi:MAG TPA: nicotinate-nucleotide--dimethylbenzimidazole phosphoribosyltransferase [Gammaproteobacteria bacterium]|nr:nicotinate-nucleotide--dimethylbenzimidazole phosphoribosyltransferase [Gammaproteobacteria bacterium]